ncbi:MAG: hypothetical protein ACTHKL_20000 [Streptosporangiaceae bacterium]
MISVTAPGAVTVPGGDGLTTDHHTARTSQTELEQLRAQVSHLQDELTRTRRQARGRRLGWRGPVAVLLIVVGCIMAPISVLSVWTANQVSNSDRYVANVAPLINEPAVQRALTDKISAAVSSQVDAKGVASRAATQLSSRGLTRLSALLSNFSVAIAGVVDGFIHSTVAKAVSGPAMASLWVRGNRAAHTQLVNARTGHNSALSVSNDKVVLSLGPLINKVKARLSARGLTLVDSLPPINPTFPLFSAKYLVKAQSLYRALTTLKWVLPLLTLVLLAAGVYVARRHRRALVGSGLGLAASMLVLGAALAIVRAVYLSKVPGSVLPADAAAVVFDTFVRFIRQGLRVLLVLGLVVALAGFFTGPSVTAVKTRQAFRSAFAAIRGSGERAGLSTGHSGEWVYAHRMPLRIGALAIAVLIFIFWTNPTGLVVLIIAIILALLLGMIELVGRPPAAPRPVSPAR